MQSNERCSPAHFSYHIKACLEAARFQLLIYSNPAYVNKIVDADVDANAAVSVK